MSICHIVDGILNGKIYSHWIGSEKHPVSNDYVCDISEIELLPLTVDWLLKFGFIKSTIYYELKCNKQFEIKISLSNSVYGYLNNAYLSIQYVHELQNLYLDLTGEELTIL